MPWFVKHIVRVHAKHLSNYNLKQHKKMANRNYVNAMKMHYFGNF